MGREIERKFLVSGDDWREAAQGESYRQGYLPTDDSCVVRVRTMGPKAVLTVKGRTEGISRLEYEYVIPIAEAEEMLDNLCRRPLIEKIRYGVDFGGHRWEVDEFKGDNEGLILAEVELESEQEKVSLPHWIGKEVSDDPRYFNVNLVDSPYTSWSR